jgi:hypothetical protein
MKRHRRSMGWSYVGGKSFIFSVMRCRLLHPNRELFTDRYERKDN